jgi:ABC-type antimicrobial peptide transport system permease subunit
VLGVPEAFIERGGFDVADSLDRRKAASWLYYGNDWASLHAELGNDRDGRRVIPVMLDASTAIYSLHLSGMGARFTIENAAGQRVTLEVVGMLKNSVLQGNLLVSEENFLRLFPETGGYRFFLIDRADDGPAGAGGAARLGQRLESALADFGFDAVDARERLAEFLAVQNTYLTTFQSLGALGLLLGTAGLAAVQLRSVLERRGELALMRACGFHAGRLARMVIWENAVLLLGGLAVGSIAAFVALVPQWAPQGAAVPWLALAGLLGAIAITGLVAGWMATRSALHAAIVPALRGE